MLKAWRQLLLNRNYALFMAGSFVSALGSWFQTVAVGWLVLEQSGSPFVLGLTNFVQLAPVLLLGLLGGALSDRIDRRVLLLRGVGTGMVAVAVLAGLGLAGWASVPSILAISLVLGLVQAVVFPAWQPFIKELVPSDQLRRAIALNSARFNVTRILGPALAGALLGRLGAPACLVVAAVGSGGVLVATWLIRRPPPEPETDVPLLESLREGLEFVRADGFTRRLLLMTAAFGVLVLPYQAFLPAFARDVLRTGEQGLGLLLTAVGLGAVAGALLTGTRLVAARPGIAMAVSGLLAGTGLTAFAAVAATGDARPWLATPALALVGMGTIGYLTAANSTLQLRVPDDLIGRVMGLWVVVNAGTHPLGSLMIGGAAERYGLPAVEFWCGVAGIGIGVLALLTRAFRGSQAPAPDPREGDRPRLGAPRPAAPQV